MGRDKARYLGRVPSFFLYCMCVCRDPVASFLTWLDFYRTTQRGRYVKWDKKPVALARTHTEREKKTNGFLQCCQMVFLWLWRDCWHLVTNQRKLRRDPGKRRMGRANWRHPAKTEGKIIIGCSSSSDDCRVISQRKKMNYRNRLTFFLFSSSHKKARRLFSW